jgi:glycosyltransferase involved in cell wall biosynthesis
MNDKVSIVVPVYNAVRFLDQAVESLKNQTHKNIEIILVDDHSTDDSISISRIFAKNDKRIKVFQTREKSGGPLRGRELGISKATGDWVTFMDCDDYVEPKYIENLLAATSDGKFDIAVTGHARVYADGRREKFLWENYSRKTNERLAEFYTNFLKHDFWTDPTDTAGQQLIRVDIAKRATREILSKMPNNLWAEDTFMALAFLVTSRNGVNFVDEHDFNWRQRDGSGSHGGFSDTADREAFYAGMNKLFAENYERFSQNLPLVSVIVPVYNSEDFLPECVESILDQTYRNLEIILVDDGSPDGSAKICDDFAKNDIRIKVIHKKNQGLNFARKSGFKKSHGKYIVFVDGDDMIDRNSIKELYENLIRNDVDIAISGYRTFTKQSELTHRSDIIFIEKILREKPELIRYYTLRDNYGITNIHRVVAWGRIFKRNIIENTDWEFSGLKNNEDELESLQWYNFAKGIYINNKPLYFYRKNPNSLTMLEYKNRLPNGKEIDNQFQFLRALLDIRNKYLPDFANEFFWSFEYVNKVFAERKIAANKMTMQEIKDLKYNYEMIIKKKERNNIELKNHLQNLENEIREVYESNSWAMTRPVRKLTNAARKIKRKIAK